MLEVSFAEILKIEILKPDDKLPARYLPVFSVDCQGKRRLTRMQGNGINMYIHVKAPRYGRKGFPAERPVFV